MFTFLVTLISKGGTKPGDESFVGNMLDWRIMYAHDPKYANSYTNEPLAHMVCAEDATNMQGVLQAKIYSEVHAYLRETVGMTSGDLLCMLCVVLWLGICMKEAEH